MKTPLAMMQTFASVCCCIMCMVTCACEGCYHHRNNFPGSTCTANRLFKKCMLECLGLTREEKKQHLLDKFRTFQVSII